MKPWPYKWERTLIGRMRYQYGFTRALGGSRWQAFLSVWDMYVWPGGMPWTL